jgi:hypothetical protein
MSFSKLPELRTISVGGRKYLDANSLLDFLAARATLVAKELRRQGTPHGDTEFLRGQLAEQEILKDATTSLLNERA